MDAPAAAKEREDRIDRLVAEYADRRARDEDPRREEVLAAHPDLRSDLERCFRMIDAGGGGGGCAPQASVLPPGLVLGDFRVLREIGRGGMGVVYEAEQAGLRRRVALKVLRSHLTLDRRQVGRFRREAEAAARLRHPGVVAIHAVGEADGHHYIAMDLVEGPTLARVVAGLAALGRHPAPADLARLAGRPDLAACASYGEAAVRLLLPAFEAVQAAHDAGLVHRDIKPSNILLDGKGAPHIADFGLARGEGDAGLSLTGEPLGTPYYMSPEQARAAADSVDGRTDVYSLGVTLYELLTMHVPFTGASVLDVLRRILSQEPARPRTLAPDVAPDVEAVVLKAMAKEAKGRYDSPREMAEDLRRALEGRPVTAPRAGPFRALLAAVAGPGPDGTAGEYRSRRMVGRWPLLHVAFGMDPLTGRPRVARGFFAVGNAAHGVFALGGSATGVFALGGLSFGVFSLGGLSAGAVAVGGAAAGLVALGGFAFGLVALGGYTIGYYASGGGSMGAHVLTGTWRDPRAVEFLERWFPWWMRFLGIPAGG